MNRPLLSPDFRSRVRHLVLKSKAVAVAQRTSVRLFLEFCRDYASLYETATAAEREYLHRQTGIDEPSLRSAYKRIGEQYAALKRHARSLPHSQESIKILARAEARKPGVLAKLVARDIVTPDASVALVRNTLRKQHPIAARASSFPTGRYGVILCDPAWSYGTYAHTHTPQRHYPTMTLAQIQALPVSELAAKHAALFLWVTSPLLPDGLAVMSAWGFTFKTVAFVWSKLHPKGKPVALLGGWTMGNVELCLLGVRGNPRRVSTTVRQLVTTPRGRHSEKPDEVRQRIVQLMGDVPRIELFARSKADGWDAWGNDVSPDLH